jgi:REP element-mobilizing transposase RayT
MEYFFGRVKDEKIFLSKAGKIIEEEWKNSAKVRTNILLDEFTIMPNHFHGILILDRCLNETRNKVTNWEPDSLGSIINQFKGKCTKRIRNLGIKEFHWQSRYYDHIIRNETDLQNIRNYIKYNHLKWNEDRYYRK